MYTKISGRVNLDEMTRDILIEWLSYDCESGALRWKKRRWKQEAGTIAGTVVSTGYRHIQLRGFRMSAHWIVWFLEHGEWPSVWLDHINGNTLDNRISNLRAVTPSQNAANKRPRRDSTSGLKGVYFYPHENKWRSQICRDGITRSLGVFDTPEAAHEAYNEAAAALFGEHAFHLSREVANA